MPLPSRRESQFKASVLTTFGTLSREAHRASRDFAPDRFFDSDCDQVSNAEGFARLIDALHRLCSRIVTDLVQQLKSDYLMSTWRLFKSILEVLDPINGYKAR